MNRKLFRSIREYKKESILAPVFVVLEVFMEVLIPLLMANIIDIGIANGDMGYITEMGILLVVMAVNVQKVVRVKEMAIMSETLRLVWVHSN